MGISHADLFYPPTWDEVEEALSPTSGWVAEQSFADIASTSVGVHRTVAPRCTEPERAPRLIQAQPCHTRAPSQQHTPRPVPKPEPVVEPESGCPVHPQLMQNSQRSHGALWWAQMMRHGFLDRVEMAVAMDVYEECGWDAMLLWVRESVRDREKWEAFIGNGLWVEALRRDAELAEAIGVMGTPARNST